MNQTNKTIFNSSWWSLQIPSEWTITEDSDCVTLTNKCFPSALQISAARKEKDLVTDEDLKDFAMERFYDVASLQECSFGSFSGFYAERIKNGFFWREWWLRAGFLMIYASYNVNEKFKNVENSIVDQIIETLEPK